MSLIDELKSAVRVSELAAEYGEVRQRGRLHVCRCLCGQNSDRNPSFTLYDQDNHFHCYACGRHGSVIDLVMLTEGLDVKTACQHLRERYLLGRGSISAPRVVTRPTATPTSHAPMRSDVAAVLRETATCYALNLANAPEVQQQLHQRGLTDTTIAQLQIGYASGNLARHLHERGQSLSLAAQIGLRPNVASCCATGLCSRYWMRRANRSSSSGVPQRSDNNPNTSACPMGWCTNAR